MNKNLSGKSILLVISGGIAAYKSLELIRLIKKSGGHVRCIITQGGQKFVTPLSAAALSEETVYTDLWSLKDETEMGHIRLSREADMIVVAPASANLIAQMAYGLAEDLASTALLAANKPILIAPAMNHMMWNNAATQENILTLKSRGIQTIGPEEGAMACGEHGPGRMAEPEDILNKISQICHPLGARKACSHEGGPEKDSQQSWLTFLDPRRLSASSKHRGDDKPLKGYTALVTSGPTFEPIDPVRFIGNRSSGKQGHAIAAALARAGASVTLISGPVSQEVQNLLPLASKQESTISPTPKDTSSPLKVLDYVKLIEIETAAEMLAACESALPADIAICAAAVSDWSPEKTEPQKIKKQAGKEAPTLNLKENPDILKTLANHQNRPKLVIGFAAETNNLQNNAKAKLQSKNCDWILANDVSENAFGSDQNHVYLINSSGVKDLKQMSKTAIAEAITQQIAEYFNKPNIREAAE